MPRPDVTDLLVVIGNVACWGTVVSVWVAGALYNAVRVPRARIRGRTTSLTFLGAIVACAIVAVFGQPFLNEYASVGVTWVRVLGLAVLVASTVFTLWARFSLGTMWSVAPRVGGDGRLRTHGPFAVTRHPIYSGLLGMLLGTTLLGGMGRWIVLVAVGFILFEVKIHMEESLLLATIPDEYSVVPPAGSAAPPRSPRDAPAPLMQTERAIRIGGLSFTSS